MYEMLDPQPSEQHREEIKREVDLNQLQKAARMALRSALPHRERLQARAVEAGGRLLRFFKSRKNAGWKGGEKMMKVRCPKIVVVCAFVLLVGVALVGTAAATPGSGIASTPVAAGNLPEPIHAKFKEQGGGYGRGAEVSRISVVKFTLEPGGTFGWHQHGGPVWAVVSSGTLTMYDGDEATCTPRFFPAGSALLDAGNHTHIGVNEGDEPVEIYATFMLPEGAQPRIDAPDPGVCS